MPRPSPSRSPSPSSPVGGVPSPRTPVARKPDAARTTARSAPARHQKTLGFRVWRVHGAGRMALPHTHPDVEINFLFDDGAVTYFHSGTVATIPANRFAVLWAGVPHQTVPPGIIGEGVWITLPLPWFLQWNLPGDFAHRLLSGQIILGQPATGERAQLERWVGDFDSGTPARRRVLLLELEARLYRLALEQPARHGRRHLPGADAAGSGQIERITQFMAEHYREPLAVPTIAEAVGLHPKYLMRVFKKHCRVSVWEYLTQLRISHAQRLLITSDLKVLDIAMESGFSSAAPFYAAFAARSRGLKPLDYRRRHRPTAA